MDGLIRTLLPFSSDYSSPRSADADPCSFVYISLARGAYAAAPLLLLMENQYPLGNIRARESHAAVLCLVGVRQTSGERPSP